LLAEEVAKRWEVFTGWRVERGSNHPLLPILILLLIATS
jgi:hypothetical protein